MQEFSETQAVALVKRCSNNMDDVFLTLCITSTKILRGRPSEWWVFCVTHENVFQKRREGEDRFTLLLKTLPSLFSTVVSPNNYKTFCL